MSEVGALVVRLQAETAEFRADLGKVKSDLDNLKDKSGETGKAIGNIGEARGGLMLFEDAIGVRLPRHLNSLLAQIPVVSAVFSTMLPLIGVAVAIKIIGSLIEKHEALVKAMHKAAEEATNAAVKEADQTHALELTNLKLDDQIAKLEHKPTHNYMKEAILETAQEVDRLAASFAADFAKMNDAISEQLNWWTEIKGAAANYFSMGVAGAVGYAAVQDTALTAVQQKMGEVEDKRRALAEAPLSAKGGAEDELLSALEKQKAAIIGAMPAFSDNAAMLLKLKSSAASTASEIKDLNLAMEAGGKRKTVAGLEQSNENLKTLQQQAEWEKIVAEGVNQHSQALIRLARSQAEAAIAAKGGDEIAQIEVAKNAEIAAAEATLVGKKAAYDAAVVAAGTDAAKIKDFDEQWANDVQAYCDAYVQFNQDADNKVAAADRQQAAAKKKLDEESLKQALEFAQKSSEQKIKFAQEDYKSQAEIVKAGFAQQEEAIASAVAHESMTWKQAQAAKIALIKEEEKAKEDAMLKETEFLEQQLQIQINANKAAAAAELVTNKGDQTDPKYLAYLNQVKLMKEQLIQLEKQLAAAQQLSGAQATAAIHKEADALSPLQQKMKQVQTQVNSDFAQMVISGKNFGQSMRNMAAQLAEEFIQYELMKLEKYLWADIQKLAHHLGIKALEKTADTTADATALATAVASDKAQGVAAAGLAGANMMASFSLAPWPIDMGAAAAGTAAMTAALALSSAEYGGKIPGSGAVPILGHGGETVVTKALTDRVEASERSGGNKGGGNLQMTYAPQVHAMDAEGVDRVLAKHSSVFQRHVAATVRRLNK